MMKFSDKALRLIGRKLLRSMEASTNLDETTSVCDEPPTYRQPRATTLREKSPDTGKARILPFRSGNRDD